MSGFAMTHCPQLKENELFVDYAILALSFGLAPKGAIYLQFERGKPPQTPNAPYRVARIKDERCARRDRELNPGGHARG
jgi:hypothetical protein